MQFKVNSYTLLGIRPQATLTEIKRIYRQKSKLLHPDTGGATEAQIELNRAYEILIDPVLRKQHDLFWKLANPVKSDMKKQRAPSETSDRPAGRKRRNRKREPSEPVSQPPPHFSRSGSALWADFSLQVKKIWERETDEAMKERESVLQVVRADFNAQVTAARFRCMLAATGMLLFAGLALLNNLFWGAVFICIYLLYKGKDLQLGGTALIISDVDWKKKLAVAAHRVAQAGYEQALASLSIKYELLLYAIRLFKQPVRPTSSEQDLALRIILVFYLTGYQPQEVRADKHLIIVTGADERVIIRYRQRRGAPVNAAYVKKLYQQMCYRQAGRGFLVVSPGLSAGAVTLAKDCCITTCSPDRLNNWPEEWDFKAFSAPIGKNGMPVDGLATFLQQNFSRPVTG